MSMHEKMPAALRLICNRWSEALIKLDDQKERIEYIRNELPALLHNQDVFVELLKCIAGGYPYPDVRKAQLFENEILLHLNTKPMFSIRMFIYEPGVFTPIHDHTSWGVIGSALGKIGVTNYVREDDGGRPGYALIRESEKLILAVGETNVALPLNQGIHQTGNPGRHTSIMVSIYGRPIRKLYIHRFDPDNYSVYRMYPPRMKKKLLAAGALDILKSK
jgi:predicted metal-dependent enzyme (double-stranded beta helix superfamily)